MQEIELRKKFEKKRLKLKIFGKWVKENICKELIKEFKTENAVKKFLQISPSVRIKETDSFIEKALYKNKKYKNPLLEITDQVGIRFVVLLVDDISRIENIIKNMVELNCEKCKDFEQEKIDNPDHFTYQSVHYIVRPKEKIKINGNIFDDKFSSEIQIRTILQHAYAEMSHASDYKPSINLPENDKKRIKRLLAKGSALVEITDDTFKDIQKMLTESYRHIDKLLKESTKIYKNITGEEANTNTKLGYIISNAYIDLLKDFKISDLQNWVDKHSSIGKAIKEKRTESILYQDSVSILLCLLISKNRITVPKLWPEDLTYLEDFYKTIGYSTQGLF
jgi:ppGpp synthetase/RelA/SpoT-type nucleotidyltranferase